MKQRKSMPLYANMIVFSFFACFIALFFFPPYRFEAIGYSWSYRVCIIWFSMFTFFLAIVIGVMSVIAARLNASNGSVPADASE